MSEAKTTAPAPVAETKLAKINNTFMPMIQRQIEGNSIHFSEYSKHCVLMAISTINAVMEKAGIDWNDPQFDKNSLTTILLNVATLQLNAAAQPREVYFQTRNIKVGNAYRKQIEMGIEGDGNDALLRRFGAGVKKVHPFWAVREGDKFTFPKYSGLSVTAPEWEPTGEGDVIRVVYPIEMDDGSIQFHITDRASVIPNLLAHISNNLMNETFGIAESRYKATPPQKKEIEERKNAIIQKAKGLGLAALDDPDLQQYISPAWTGPHAQEAMILRKMRNNITKKIPKDFGNGFITETYAAVNEDTQAVQREIAEHSAADAIEIVPDPEDVSERPEALPGPVDPVTGEIHAEQQAMDPGF